MKSAFTCYSDEFNPRSFTHEEVIGLVQTDTMIVFPLKDDASVDRAANLQPIQYLQKIYLLYLCHPLCLN